MRHRVDTSKEDIRYTTGESILGAILIASSGKGVVAVMLGKDAEQLERSLQRRFPKARLLDGDKESHARLKQVLAYIESPARGLNLPLDIRGTDFQKRVWEVVRKLPVNQMTTYKQVARNIGSPKSMRAVGNACGSNALFLAIPCHRVLHSDGSVCRGWEAGAKGALIEREMAVKGGK